MSSTALRYLIAVAIAFHGIGHMQGVVVGLGLAKTERWTGRSWLLTGLLGENVTRILGITLWLVCFMAFILVALALLGWGVPHDWWRPLAVPFAIVSLVTLFLYWNSLAMFFNKAGALGMNLAILIGLLLMNWPSETQIGY